MYSANASGDDHAFKLGPLLDHLQWKYIPYHGNHFGEQFIKGKPISFGFKVCIFCSRHGYIHAFDLCTGKKDSFSKTENVFCLSGNIMLDLIDAIGVPDNKSSKIFLDNYFTNTQLTEKLFEKGICASETCREISMDG